MIPFNHGAYAYVMQYNHLYLAVFTSEDNFKKWVGVVNLLTQLTASMFLLALVSLDRIHLFFKPRLER